MANRWNLVGKRVREIRSSTCSTENRITTTLSLEVTADHYPNLEAMGVHECARSGVFLFGGYDWGIELYPHGWGDGNALACLCFLSLAGHVDGEYTLTVLRKEGEEPLASFDVLEVAFSAMGIYSWCTPLNPLPELVDGGFTLQYVVTVFKDDSPVMELPSRYERMLGDPRAADVTFFVDGEEVHAHRSVLAVASPVFDALIFGPMAEKDMRCIKVVDMEPAIFKMMLYSIYTDLLPSCNDQGGRSAAVMQHLLVAADRYGLDRLKLMCEQELSGMIDAHNIMPTYALANRHHCDGLKGACLVFLMRSPQVLGTVLETSGFNELCVTNYHPLPLEGGTKRSHPQEETDPGQKLKRTRDSV